MKSLYYIIILFALLSCNRKPYIYEKIPKKSLLTKETLLKSERIIINHEYLVLSLFNVEGIPEYSSYLLFYDNKLKLQGACKSEVSIKSIKQDTIYGCYNKLNYEHTKQYIPSISLNDLPKEYYIDVKGIWIRSQLGIRNRIIDKIQLNFDKMQVTLDIRESENSLFAGFTNDIDDSDFSDNFTKRLKVKYKISDLSFDYEHRILAFKERKGDTSKSYEMLIPNKKVLDSFYNELWEKLKKYKNKF